VPHVGGQQGKLGSDVGSLSIPAQQGVDGKAMAVMPISALSAACRVLDYAESGGVAFLPTPFDASFRTPLTK